VRNLGESAANAVGMWPNPMSCGSLKMCWTGLTLAKEDPDSHLHVTAALERLQEVGPALSRPTVGAIEKSRYRNMRDCVPAAGGR